MKYEVIPTNGRKSFYGKAIVTEEDGEKVLTSYTTEVAKIDKKGRFIKLWDGYSLIRKELKSNVIEIQEVK